jgi:phage terminase small subunit
MRRGAKTKPIALKKLAGTLERSRLPSGPEPLAPGEIQGPPAHLSPRQREIWAETLAHAPRQLWRQADIGMLEGYVIGRSLLEAANLEQQRIDADSQHRFLVLGDRGIALSPYLRVIRLAAEMVARFGAELGMSPSARSALSVDEALAEPGKDWSRLDALLAKAANYR